MPPNSRQPAPNHPPPRETFNSLLAGPALLVLLSAITLSIYWPGLNGPFLFDDISSIENIDISEPSAAELTRVVLGNSSGMFGRPISVLSLTLTHLSSGPWPPAFKYTNLMLHILIGWLLFWLGGRLIPVLMAVSAPRAWLISSLTAGLWLLHPLQVSTVLYAVQRMAQLSALFTVAAVLIYLIGRKRIQDDRPLGLPLILVLVPPLTLLAILSKENGALTPLFILVTEVMVCRRWKPHAPDYARNIAFTAVALIPLLIGGLYVITHWDSLLIGYGNRSFTLEDRLLTEPRAIWFYLGLILLPQISRMGLFHDDFGLSNNLDPITLLAIVGILGLLTAIFALRRSQPAIAFALAWFLAGHAMESTFLPLELVFEHRNYLAMYGLLLAIPIYLLSGKPSAPSLRTGILVSIAILSLLGSQTAIRLSSWKDITTFMAIAAQDHPNSLRAQVEFANMIAMYGKDIDAAKSALRNAVNIAPDNPAPRIHLLGAYCIGENFPEDLMSSSLRLLETGYVTPYAISTIKTLQVRLAKDTCPNISPDQVIALQLAALKNPRIPKGDRYQLLLLHARTNRTAGYFDTAAAIYDQAFNNRHTQPTGRQAQSLLEKMQMEAVFVSSERAKITFDRLRQLDQESTVDFSPQIRATLESILIRPTTPATSGQTADPENPSDSNTTPQKPAWVTPDSS